MRVALLSLHFAEYAARLALALSRHHELLVVLGAGNARQELSPALLRALRSSSRLEMVERVPARDLRWPGVALRVRRLIREHGADVIHVQEIDDLASFASVVPRAGPPLVLTVHDLVARDARMPPHQRWHRYALRCRSDAVIVHGERLAEEYARRAESRGHPVHSVAHGALLHDPDDAPPAPEPGRLLFFGRMEPYKGLGVLLEACEQLRGRGRDFQLVVAGQGSELHHHARLLDRAPWVSVREGFVPVDEARDLFRRAWITVLPYLDASQSGVAAMALAHGCPVVATRVGALEEVVRHEESGILAKPGDAASLAESLDRLLGDPLLRQRLSAGAAHIASTTLSWAAIASRTTEIYESLRIPATQVRRRRAQPPASAATDLSSMLS